MRCLRYLLQIDNFWKIEEAGFELLWAGLCQVQTTIALTIPKLLSSNKNWNNTWKLLKIETIAFIMIVGWNFSCDSPPYRRFIIKKRRGASETWK